MASPRLKHVQDSHEAEDERLSREAEEALHAGVGVPLSEIVEWVESWGTGTELPPPPVRKVM